MIAMVFLVILLAKPGGDGAVTWIDDITLTVFSLAATVFTAAAAARNWGSRRGVAWAFISLGLLMNTFGEVAWGVQELAMGKEDVFPSVADIGYLGLYPPVFLGLLLLPQAPTSGFWRLKMSIDVLVGVAAVAVITSTVVLGSVISASDTTGAEKAVSLAYPLADLAIIFAVLALIARSSSTSAVGPLVFLALGFGAIAFSDSLYTYLTQIGKYDSGSYIDAGWLAGYTLVALAGAARAHVYASSEPTAAKDDPPRLWQEVSMYAPVVALAGLILIDGDLRHVLPLAVFIGIVALMFIRQLITHSEILRIYERQLGFADELESKVRAQTLELWRRRAWEKKEHDPKDVNLPAPTRDWDGGEAPPIPSPTRELS